MAERFQKIPGTQKISESYGVIDQNFERLDDELSAIEQRIEGLDTLSPADRAKLDGIEEGAQVNQNAFAKVNDLEASNPSDAVTITGGTGITVTTNPNTKEVNVTATGEATPGPHGSAHLEFGSDPIPYATTTEGGLMSAADKQKLEEHETRIQGLETYSPTSGIQANTYKDALNQLGRAGKNGIFKTPDEIPLRTGPLIYRKNMGRAELVTDLRKYFPAGANSKNSNLKAYYVSPTGDDANTGLDWSQALASVATALAKPDVDIVYVAAGIYINGKHMGNYTGTRDHSIQAVGGPVYFISSNFIPPSWVATGTPTIFKYNYPDAATGVVALDYKDEYGLPYILEKKANIPEVAAKPGSWTQLGGAGTELFVHLPDGAAPVPGRVIPYVSAPIRVSAPGVKHHHKGITFIGGSGGAFSARNADENTVVIGEDSAYIGQHMYDGFQIKDVGLAVAIRCIAAKNANDGFNYHAQNGVAPTFIEIDCVGVNNLAVGTGNGSSAHEDISGVRINCDYAFNAGPGVSDVNDAKTININCTSRENGPDVNASGFQVNASGGTASMWLDGCNSDGNAGGDIKARDNGKIFWRDTHAITVSAESGGVISEF